MPITLYCVTFIINLMNSALVLHIYMYMYMQSLHSRYKCTLYPHWDKKSSCQITFIVDMYNDIGQMIVGKQDVCFLIIECPQAPK